MVAKLIRLRSLAYSVEQETVARLSQYRLECDMDGVTPDDGVLAGAALSLSAVRGALESERLVLECFYQEGDTRQPSPVEAV